jgi:protein-arginine kinase activator protein McsA
MKCQSCDKQRNELHVKKSRLMAGMTLNLCNECIETKKEPRFLIILTGRLEGSQFVADYIKNRRYCGPEITARELVK